MRLLPLLKYAYSAIFGLIGLMTGIAFFASPSPFWSVAAALTFAQSILFFICLWHSKGYKIYKFFYGENG